MAKTKDNMIGGIAFLAGVIIAVVLGLGLTSTYESTVLLILVILGIAIGLLNIADEEAKPFLMSATVLVIVSALGGASFSNIMYASGILRALLILFIPATIVVAIRNVFMLARS